MTNMRYGCHDSRVGPHEQRVNHGETMLDGELFENFGVQFKLEHTAMRGS